MKYLEGGKFPDFWWGLISLPSLGRETLQMGEVDLRLKNTFA